MMWIDLLSIVLYELAALVKPFDASNMPAIIFRIMKSQPAPLPPGYSDDLKEMVAQLLKPLPSDRPSVDDILSMPIVELHLRRWRATSRRLRGPLPTPDGGGGKSTPDDGSMREDTDDRVPKPASFLTPPTPSSAQQQKKDRYVMLYLMVDETSITGVCVWRGGGGGVERCPGCPREKRL